MNPNHIFSSSDLIPNVNLKDKPHTKQIHQVQEKDNDYDDLCPNCNNLLSEHTVSDKIQCALSRIRMP